MRRLLLVVVLVLAFGACSSGDAPERASGVTERWLQAVSDTGRSRIADDARARAADDGAVEVAAPLLRGAHDEDDSWFADLEVGRAHESGATARVPYRVTREHDERELHGVVVLSRTGDTWRVVGLDSARAGELVPSDGGAEAAGATARHWLAAIALGAIATVLSALVIEMQPVPGRR